MVVHIQLTRGFEATVDDEDAELVLSSRRKWFTACGRRKSDPQVYYALRHRDYPGQHILMHRLILDAPEDMEVDHIDGNGLNNRRSNLRLATKSQNAINRRVNRPNKSSRFRGVCWNRKSERWQASIRTKGKSVYLGLFEREEDAAAAYDEFAAKEFGEFAVLNFDQEQAA